MGIEFNGGGDEEVFAKIELVEAVGWNSVVVFSNSEESEKPVPIVETGKMMVVLSDPWPEYTQFKIDDDGVEIVKREMSKTDFKDRIGELHSEFDEAKLVNIDDVEIERDEHANPVYVGLE